MTETPETDRQDEDRVSLIELRARLAKLEVELVNARRLNVDEIRTNGIGFFNKHGTIGLLFGIFVQTAGVIWWASTITNQVHEIQRTVEGQQRVLESNAAVLRDNADRLTRVQTVQENVVKILDQHTFQDRDSDTRFPGKQPKP